MRLKVNEYLTLGNIQDLTSFGFESGYEERDGITFYKEYGEHFELILNPYLQGEVKSGKIIINYFNEDIGLNGETIDEDCDFTEIYFDIELLINAGIIIKE